MSGRDYLREMNIDLVDVFGSTRVLGKDTSVFFGGLDTDTVRLGINRAMDVATKHYLDKAGASRFNIPESDVFEISLKVVLSYLYMYHCWRNTSDEYRDRPLMINQEDLTKVQAEDAIYFYFKKKYPSNSKQYAAALTGMSSKEFDSWLIGRERFASR